MVKKIPFTAIKQTIHYSDWSKRLNTSNHGEKGDRWMDKEDVVHIYNGILLSHKKEWNNVTAATWMQLEIIILSEVSQRKTNSIWSHLYGESKEWTRKFKEETKNKLLDTENRLVAGDRVGRNGWRGQN